MKLFKICLTIVFFALTLNQVAFAKDFISPLDFNYEEVVAAEKAAKDYDELIASGTTWQKAFLAKIDAASNQTYTTVNGTVKNAVAKTEAFEVEKVVAMSEQYDMLALRILTIKVLDDIAATLDMEQNLSKQSTATDFQKVLTAWKKLETSFNFRQLKNHLS